ncbi:TPA: hypothetical protein H1005_04230 [archaeon]|nr:hypothetical protein [Candidatus Naiadarchaeales archaeon SRR2090153.bin1042]
MELPWKKKTGEFSEEELLEEIKKETAELSDMPDPIATPAMLPPTIQRPTAIMPMPSSAVKPQLPPPPPIPGMPPLHPQKPTLSTQEVAKLPLFMKVEEYDRIVSDLHILFASLEKMGEILINLSTVEENQRKETQRWKEQLDTTRDLLNKLLSHMPETGRLKAIVEERKKQQQKEKIKTEITDLQKDLKKVVVHKPTAQLSSEIQNLRSNISGIQDEMHALHEELKNLAEATKQKAAEGKKAPSYHDFPRPTYQKTEIKKPW